MGLDTDPARVPSHLRSEPDPVLAFNRAIIEATADYAVAYKPNLAFFEALGPRGWHTLAASMEAVPRGIFTIADAKRGDIGNTATRYAEAFFHQLNFDAITVAPYMGSDSVLPFLQFEGKWIFLLALTSNPGAADFQMQTVGDEYLYERVVNTALGWAEGQPGTLGFVAGATRPAQLGGIRERAPHSFMLVPGVGAQGGSLSEVMATGMNEECGLLVNASRSILYASSGEDFAEAARAEAARMVAEMDALLKEKGI